MKNNHLTWTGVGAAAVLGLVGLASASSHREAPLVAGMPQVDATDFYMFMGYEPGKEDRVILAANYLPFQDPYGGPNYFAMDPEARYEIKIDNDGDAVEDITFRFAFEQKLSDIQLPVGNPGSEINVSVPLVQVGPIAGPNDPNQNVREEYSVSVVFGTGPGATKTPVANSSTGSTRFEKPLDNIGTKTIPDYDTYDDDFIYTIDLPGGFTGRMFVGQRKESFVVNLGETFDLVNLANPLGPVNGETNSLEGKNVTTFALELPRVFAAPTQTNIGGWTSATLPWARTLKKAPTFEMPTGRRGSHFQVSRLANPLFNEAIIGLPDKNLFNASQPLDDLQFLKYVTNPTLPELLEILFGTEAPNFFPRDDLRAMYFEGFFGLNDTGGVGEMLRLNTAIPSVPAAMQDELGAFFGDFAGYPNGRRPGDDIVDIALRAAMGAILPPAQAPSGQLPFTDGAFIDATRFDEAFPYLTSPIPGSPQQ